MKQLKKLTREMKVIIAKSCYKPENWGLVEKTVSNFTIRHKKTGTLKEFPFRR